MMDTQANTQINTCIKDKNHNIQNTQQDPWGDSLGEFAKCQPPKSQPKLYHPPANLSHPPSSSTDNIPESHNLPSDFPSDASQIDYNQDFNDFLSQELRTPLTSIRGAIGLLQSGVLGELSPQSRSLLAIALNNTNRLERLTQTLENADHSYSPIVSGAVMARLRLQNDLRNAIDNHQFFLVYQPIVNTATQEVMGFEALIRWQHPQKGMISPAEFIPLAEGGGMIHELGLWVLKEACEQLKKWQIDYPKETPLSVSVNLSAMQLSQPNLVKEVCQIVKETEIVPGSLHLELTESALLENQDRAIQVLRQLRALDIPIYLDDFGTGYSSLSRLQMLPIHVLKIDQSFTKTENWTLVQVILQLAENLGLSVIAEGVETAEQLDKLHQLKCPLTQGYLFSKPLSTSAAAELLSWNFK